MPNISVIVPVYNSEQYLNNCISSILQQTYTDFELILVNDGSTDESGVICDQFAQEDSRIHVIHKENEGPSIARNTGIDWSFENSFSKWLAFIDSDDWIHKRYLECLYNLAEQSKLKVVSCKYMITNTIELDQSISDQPSVIIDSPENLYLNHHIDLGMSCLSLYSKDLFFSMRYPIGIMCEDMRIITPILFSQKRIGFIDEVLYYYNLNPTGLSNREPTPRWINDLFLAHTEQVCYLAENGFFLAMDSRLSRYKYLFCKYYSDFGKNDLYSDVFCKNYSCIKSVYTRHKEEMIKQNSLIKKFGFREWFTGQADALEQLKTDSKKVADERGRLFALLWKIKNRISIYSYYRKMPV